MYQIYFYKDKHGRQPVKDYIDKLQDRATKSKESRIKLKKIYEYIEVLENNGTIFWKDDTFVLLHSFHKKTQKTPRKEITKAKNNLKDFLKRSE